VPSYPCIDPDSSIACTADTLSEVVDSVRHSYFIGGENSGTIDCCMTDLFGGKAPRYEAFQAPDGICYVNCAGRVYVDGTPVKIALQFEMSGDLESFSLVAMSIGGRMQTDEFMENFQADFAM
jgi:hypothetical protein